MFTSFYLVLALGVQLCLSSSEHVFNHLDNPAHNLGKCSSADYAAGRWQLRHPSRHRPDVTRMNDPADAYAFSGFEGCASSREVPWHLATDTPSQYDRFPAAHDYEWIPGPECKNLSPWSVEDVIRHLVHDGGWLLVGDSMSEINFFSLSCLLYPHVRATPNYGNGTFDRSWPQHLYLVPSSPLLTRSRDPLVLPPKFNISTTPIVSFRRNDVLFAKSELEAIYPLTKGYNRSRELFSDELAWFISPRDYLDMFTKPRPLGAGYSTLIVATAAHWSTSLFSAYNDERKAHEGWGIDGVLDLYRLAMAQWVNIVELKVDEHHALYSHNGTRKRVLVREYLPGHENCRSRREPWTIYPDGEPWSYNWGYMKEFNKLFRGLVARSRDISFLDIARPGLLRPDTHSTGDCLHIMTGSGVVEGWSHYVWHYITHELQSS